MDNLIFHHYGVAVKDFLKAIEFFSNLGYKIGDAIIDDIQKVELILCVNDNKNYPNVELIKPINSKSPINNYLKINNEIIYHVCYEMLGECNVEKVFQYSRAICISTPKPAILFNYRKVSFYYIKGVGIIEILHQQ